MRLHWERPAVPARTLPARWRPKRATTKANPPKGGDAKPRRYGRNLVPVTRVGLPNGVFGEQLYMHYGKNVLLAFLLLSAACSGAANSPTGVDNTVAQSVGTSASNDTSATKDTSKTTPKDTSKTQPDTSKTKSDTSTHTSPGTSPDTSSHTTPPPVSTAECSVMHPGWLFCDDFEQNRLSHYFEYTNPNGSFTRTTGVGLGGSTGMRATFAPGQSDAGSLKVAFGKTPSSYIRPVDAGTTIYREIYWRMYVKNDSTWTGGGGDKLSRAQSLANSQWAQAMVAPIWSGNPNSSADNYLYLDPATGVSGDTLLETAYNDFAHQHYLGSRQGVIPIFDASHVGKWYCVEAHVRLNDAGQSNGIFEYWINGQLQASRSDLNWIGSYSAYGINVIFFENYWNNGSPKAQSRYFDNIVISTQPIGCIQGV